MINKFKAFSLVELLIALVVISVMLSAFVPVVTKRLSTSKTQNSSKIDTVPVGAMVYWYGKNIPDKWMPVSKQNIEGDEYIDLRKALGDENIKELPNLNMFGVKENSISIIIKAKK